MRKFFMMFLAIAGMAVFANAAYIDASASNTTRADGDAELTGWTERAYANEGSIYQSFEGAEMIVTTVTGLTPGAVYEVGVNYWNASGQFWCVSAGLSSDAMAYFADPSNSSSAQLGESTLTGVTEADRFELLGIIGEIAADANGEIKVYIDDEKAPDHATYNNRAWYDGVTVTEVPEPMTMSLLGLGGLVLARRR